MNLKSTSVVAASVIALSSAMAQAEGIKGNLKLTNGSRPVVLVDKDNLKQELGAGRYDVRLSNQSKSMAYTNLETNQKVTVKVTSGFPGGDLRNFSMKGAAFGQSVDFRGITRDLPVGPVRRYITEDSCRVYYPGCGQFGCMGWQTVEERIQTYSRIFKLDFIDPAGLDPNANVMAQFQGTVSTENRVLSSYPLGPCRLRGGYPEPRPRPFPGPRPYPYFE